MGEENQGVQNRGGRIDPDGERESPLDDDERIDQAIEESFPASDPPSFNAGIDDEPPPPEDER
jgi:hypothetical protein